MPTTHFLSLRTRFLLIVLFGALLPMAIAGAWLAQSSVRSAEGLLRTQLDTSVKVIASRTEERWGYRRGDLLLLADNEVTRRTVGSKVSIATSSDSEYMARLYAALQPTMVEVRLLGTDGTVHWVFGDSTSDLSSQPQVTAGVRKAPAEFFRDTLTIRDASDRPIGRLEAHILLSAILPADSVPILVKDAELTIADHRSGQTLEFAGSGNAPRDVDRFLANGHSWLAVHEAMTAPALDLTVAAPEEGFVGPFERTEKLGLAVLVAVIALAVLLSSYFTARITRSLERMVGAADAIAAGDLARNVDANGRDEVGRLGTSFNTMTQSLRRTLDELAHREALAAVGEFAASLSHEVRNGLSSVRLDLQRVEEGGPVAEERGALVTRALRNVRRLDSTVTGALAVARSGRAALEPVDLRAVLNAAHQTAEGAFLVSGATLSIMVPEQSCLVRGDATALEQLFLNLLLNAAQAMGSGGEASLTLEMVAESWQVSLRDEGSGMAADHAARSGQAFVTSKRGGTGLGISIARKIAEVHGGEISFESEVGQGTTVRVRLPVVEEVAEGG